MKMKPVQNSKTQTDRQTPDKVIPMCRYASQATQLCYQRYKDVNLNRFFSMANDFENKSLILEKKTGRTKRSFLYFLIASRSLKYKI